MKWVSERIGQTVQAMMDKISKALEPYTVDFGDVERTVVYLKNGKVVVVRGGKLQQVKASKWWPATLAVNEINEATLREYESKAVYAEAKESDAEGRVPD